MASLEIILNMKERMEEMQVNWEKPIALRRARKPSRLVSSRVAPVSPRNRRRGGRGWRRADSAPCYTTAGRRQGNKALTVNPELQVRVDRARGDYLRENDMAQGIEILRDFHGERIRPPRF